MRGNVAVSHVRYFSTVCGGLEARPMPN
jgi:hypothetical protein